MREWFFLKYISKKQLATLIREGEERHFWAGGVVFALQFEKGSFDMPLYQQVLSAVVASLFPNKIFRR